jgi:hypothetical protein
MPARLPAKRYYKEGDDGLTLDYRWTEHWQPRPIWDSLHINTPKVSLRMPAFIYRILTDARPIADKYGATGREI